MDTTRFTVEFADEVVLDEIRNLPKPVQIMISKAIKEKLTTDPVAFGKPLRYSLKGHRSLRVGNYRVIYRIEEKRVNVLIVKIDIRRDVYE